VSQVQAGQAIDPSAFLSALAGTLAVCFGIIFAVLTFITQSRLESRGRSADEQEPQLKRRRPVMQILIVLLLLADCLIVALPLAVMFFLAVGRIHVGDAWTTYGTWISAAGGLFAVGLNILALIAPIVLPLTRYSVTHAPR
jgi:protein-S-isoprenylcysteine O-methyltransferase Ste14